MYQKYLEELKVQIKSHKLIKKHAILRSNKWTMACYELFADMVSTSMVETLPKEQIQAMGLTLSGRTIFNIFKDDYKLGFPPDPRTVNTLSKLTIFIGYKDWNDFVSATDEINDYTSDDESKLTDQIMRQISRYMYAVLEYMQNLEPGGFQRIYDFQDDKIEISHPVSRQNTVYYNNQWTISNAFNPSEAELQDIDIVFESQNVISIFTKERWLLCWFEPELKKYVKRWDRLISIHYYCRINEEGKLFIMRVSSL